MLDKTTRDSMIDMLEYFVQNTSGYESFSDDTLIRVFDEVMQNGDVIANELMHNPFDGYILTMIIRYNELKDKLTEYILLVD